MDVYGLRERWLYDLMDGWIDWKIDVLHICGWMHFQIYGMNEMLDQWMDGVIDGWIDENASLIHFLQMGLTGTIRNHIR